MRKPIILYLMLFCLIQYCSGSETEKEALKEKQEKVELNFSLNNEVMKAIKRDIKSFSFLDLCFAKQEFLELIKNDSSFRDAWKEKVALINGWDEKDAKGLTPYKDPFNYYNKDVEFFNGVFLKGQTGNYAEQVAFLKQYHFKAVGNNYLSVSDYAYAAAKYRKTSNLAEMYMTIYDLLLLDTKNLLDEIDKNPEAKDGFRRWLTDVGGETGIVDYALSSVETMKRRRDYVVSLLEKIDNPLARETLEVLKNAAINPID